MRVLFLDIDGVLNRTGYRPAVSLGLRSWIEPELARRLARLLATTGADIVLSSAWRLGRTVGLLRDELRAAGVDSVMRDVTPALSGQPRWCEIAAWMHEHAVTADQIAIVDDGFDMGPLAPRFVRTSPLVGLDEDAAGALAALLA
ncbi:MAG: HAD domain-containing protein [Myxococcota bacterium]|nr:HAD domain-containing protein [Myxococcota bacterium]